MLHEVDNLVDQRESIPCSKARVLAAAETLLNEVAVPHMQLWLGDMIAPSIPFGEPANLRVREQPAGTYVAALWEYAVGGIWGPIWLHEVYDPVVALVSHPELGRVTELLLGDEIPRQELESARQTLLDLARLAHARSKLDLVVHSSAINDIGMFAIESDESSKSVAFSIGEISMLTGYTQGYLRYYIMDGSIPLTPASGADAAFRGEDVAAWIAGQKLVNFTTVLKRDEFWRRVGVGLGDINMNDLILSQIDERTLVMESC